MLVITFTFILNLKTGAEFPLCIHEGNNIYNQNNGLAMVSPLGPILANIFMVELEHSVIPGLVNKLVKICH